MARIQVDFDEVMRFGDLHGDIGRALDVQRGVFRLDAGRLDQIVNVFGLERTTSSSHFQGLSIAAALGDADARAGRTSHTLLLTSTRIFQHASRVTDDRFDWAGAAFKALAGPLSGPFGMARSEIMGDELASQAASGVVRGVRVAPGLGVLLPVFAGVSGLLNIIDGASGLLDTNRDTWSTVSSSLELLAGVIGLGVALGGAAVLIAAGVAAAPVVVAIGAPFLLAATVLSFGALMIEQRETVGDLLSGATRWASGVVRGVAETATETAHDLLSTAGDVWSGTVGLALGRVGSAVDELWSAAEEVRNLLVPLVVSAFRPFWLTPGPEPQAAPVAGPSTSAKPDAPTTAPAETAPRYGKPRDGSGALPPKGLQDYLAGAGIRPSPDKDFRGPPENGQEDQWGKAAYNCTSWAAFRRVGLGLGVPPRGHGGKLGTDKTLPPTLGAMVSYESGEYGHVMIVEEIMSPTQFRVSEMNHDNKGGFFDQRIWTKQPDGTWSCEKPYRRSKDVLKFTK